MARPYLDTRHNEIHTRISFGMAARLLDHEAGDPEVVLPAIILHDIGWKSIPDHLHLQAFGPKATDPGLNRVHEVEGARIARCLLEQVGTEAHRIAEICEIIEGHDSRRDAISQNDRIVKDADKLWRFSREGFAIDVQRFGQTYAGELKRIGDNLPKWFLTPTGRRMALELLDQRAAEIPS